MKHRLHSILSALLTGLAILFLTTCERDWNNPWDEFNNLSPEAWAPQNLQIEEVSITAKKLTWTLGDYNIEGFILDRKKGDEPWQVAYQTFPTETRNWNDTEIIPDPLLTYEYRLYSFAGKFNSGQITKSVNAKISAPLNLLITRNSITAVTLTWQDNINGEEGFKIDRKINSGAWEIEYAAVGNNQKTFADNNSTAQNWSDIYHYRVYAFFGQYNSNYIENSVSFCGFPFTDTRDGNVYETVEIGNQCWMKENLAYLPSVSPSSNGSQTTPYYYVYDYQGNSVTSAKATANYQTYGVLYNWPASLNACPDGWHLPSDAEWTALFNYVSSQPEYLCNNNTDYIAKALAATTLWKNSSDNCAVGNNLNTNNSTNFTALPSGHRRYQGNFNQFGDWCDFWSSTQSSEDRIKTRSLCYYSSYFGYGVLFTKDNGYGVRCLRNE